MRYSVTQIETHLLCPRKYYYLYCMNLPKPPPTPGMARGDFGHGVLENYHKTGAPIDLRALPDVRNGIRFIYPFGTPGVVSEGKIVYPLGGVEAIGKVDIINTGAFFIDSQGEKRPLDVPEVVDYKFNKSPTYWKTGAQLRSDIQMNVYGLALFKLAPRVRLSHVAFETSSPFRAAKTTVLQERSAIAKVHTEVVFPEIESIKDTRTCKDVGETRVKRSGCSAFGGCAFQKRCTKTQGEHLMSSLLNSKIKALLEKKTPGGVVTQPSSNGTGQGPLMVARPKSGAVGQMVPLDTAAPKTGPTPITPPHVGPAPMVPQTNPSANKGRSRAEISKPVPQAIPEGYTQLEDGSIVPIPEDEDLGESGQQTTSYDPPVYRKEEDMEEVSSPGISRANAGLRIFVNCIPKRVGQLEELDMYLLQRCKAIAEHFEVEDIRTATGDSPLAYGRWKGFLIASIRNEPPPAGDYLVTGTSETKDCLVEALEPYADMFVVG